MNYECLICQVKSLEKRIEKYKIPVDRRNQVVSQIIKEIAAIDLETAVSPEITRNILCRLKKESTVEDPYSTEKEEGNAEMMVRYEEFRNRVLSSENPFDTALRLAIAGNIIDFGPGHAFDVAVTIDKVLASAFAIDHSQQLYAKIEKAKTILYLGDNCGEIVLDKLFLETIKKPDVWFAVRGKPVLNDATEKEARDVGIHQVAEIISNGDDAPSTLLHRVSPQFLELYHKADLIISKGMGNYEGLMLENDPRLFFLLMVKCPVIGLKTGTEMGQFIVKRSARSHQQATA
ncbi:MAG: damage-control phosphatase ARMT1 family protein [Mariniphaga sp.]